MGYSLEEIGLAPRAQQRATSTMWTDAAQLKDGRLILMALTSPGMATTEACLFPGKVTITRTRLA
jgi:hypothetical protein